MYKNIFTIIMTLAILFGLLLVPAPVQAETCTATGYVRDGINLTAAYINPVSVPSEIDATGCHIGIYFDDKYEGTATLDGVEIYGAKYFGVMVNGAAGPVSVNILNSDIHNIGEVPFNGAQHGNAIYYAGLNGHAVTGTVDHNSVSAYQKGGITVNGLDADVTVTRNTVTGLGRISFIAQNGIQFGWGAKGVIEGNKVSENFYWCQGPAHTCDNGWISAGILLYQPDSSLTESGATAKLKEENTLINNQVEVMIVR